MYVYIKYVYLKQLKRGTNNFLYQQLFNTDDVAVGGRSRVPKKNQSQLYQIEQSIALVPKNYLIPAL